MSCAHVRWTVRDSDALGMVRCDDCGQSVKLVTVLVALARRVDDCIRMVYARMGEVDPISAEVAARRVALEKYAESTREPAQVIAGRMVEDDEEEDMTP